MSKIFDLIEKEQKRQNETIELIASENFVSNDVLAAMGSCLTNKYSEGYPRESAIGSGNKGRYYGGCEVIDEIENYCRLKWKEVFNTDYHVNVQPHSGSSANLAAYMAVLKPGDTILAMSLENGGHLTHGSSVNFSGQLYNMCFYNVDKNGFIDYDDIKNKINETQPKLVLAGASAYSRIIDFEKIYNIIQNCNLDIKPLFMVDMAHIAGLVTAGEHPSPFGLADIVTTTTHKTLRGPRGGMIFCKPELARAIDKAVFPGTQGGPLQHIIAAKAVAAEECLTQEYKNYISQVVKNSKVMAETFKSLGYSVVTNGTDNHLFLIDFSQTHPWLSGKVLQDTLDKVGITLNKNCVPNEKRSPVETSGVRIGTAAMTTKGFTQKDFIATVYEIDTVIKNMAKNN